MLKKILAIFFGLLLGVILLGGGAFAIAVTKIYPTLPELKVLKEYRPKIPMRIYTADNLLIGEFGEERRSFVKIQDVPQLMKQAILAAEDNRFYQHSGVDYIGVLRAIYSNITSGRTRSGASTITMQVAKNFFLSPEKTMDRKFREALLSYKIEKELTKDQILELYINQIYLGQHAYGFAAAAKTYFGKTLQQLTPAEMAMLAGLPTAPSASNPIANPVRAKQRQMYVLSRMHEFHYITDEQYTAAKDEPIKLTKPSEEDVLPAQDIAEMTRIVMQERYGEAAYTEGLRVYTTIDSQSQKLGFNALRAGLINYDKKFPYRGAESQFDLSSLPKSEDERDAELDEILSKPEIRDTGDMEPGIVLTANNSEVNVYLRGSKVAVIKGQGLNYAKRAINSSFPAAKRIQPGSLVRVRAHEKGHWEIVQMPEVEGAFVAIKADDGAIKTLIGGFNFYRRKFNHVTQAWRQPGSTFKPFIYSAGIERGMTPITQINDAPLSIPNSGPGGSAWQPKNSDGKYAGMITLRRALTWSKNLVSIRVLMAIGIDYGQQYLQRFGFSPKNHPASLTIALGSGSVTPLQMAEGYAVFANGGYRVSAYFIDRIEDINGRVIARTAPAVAGKNAQLAIDPRNAFIMTSMLRDVVRYGTASRAMSLKRNDVAGKTGTTNDFRDAWFAGFSGGIVAITWIGYDQPKSLGRYGFGGTASLPVWIDYMSKALKGQPEVLPEPPAGLVQKGDEYFYQEHLTTNPNLFLDNRGSVPNNSQDHEAGTFSETNNNNNTTESGYQESPKPPTDPVQNIRDQLF